MALLSAKSLAGPGYIILNTLRAMNIVTLLAVVAASVVMLVKTFVVSKFFFFDAVSHVITGFTSLFLLVSECSIFRGYFARNWPLLSPAHGFVALGLAMDVLGLNILGNMNKEATSETSLGLPFWRLVVAAGILAVIIGIFNVIASYVFRDSANGITARRVRSHGAVAASSEPDPEIAAAKAISVNTTSTAPSPFSPSVKSPAQKTPRISFSAFSPARTFRHARESLLPSYHSNSPARMAFRHNRSSSRYSRSSSGEGKKGISRVMGNRKNSRDSVGPRMPLNISAPLNVNPQFAHLVRPDMAHHPSVRKGEEGLAL